MDHQTSTLAVIVFMTFVGAVLGISFWLGRQAKSAQGFFAAHGQIPWFVNGIAFAGDYLSAASFLGICGMIAFFGYDGFLYSIGYLAGWVVALFVIAEPIKKLGKFTFADALDARFNSRGIKLTAAISTLIVSIFYLIPQMVGAGALIQPLLGLEHWHGVLLVGSIVVVIVITAGMVSTTWVQFIKGSLLVLFCAILTVAILARGLWNDPYSQSHGSQHAFILAKPAAEITAGREVVPAEGAWAGKPYVRLKDEKGVISVWRTGEGGTLSETQTVLTTGGEKLFNGTSKADGGHLWPVGHISKLPGDVDHTGPLGPGEFLQTIQDSTVVLWGKEVIKDGDSEWTVWFQKPTPGAKLMVPGNNPLFKGISGDLPAIDPAKPETQAAYDKALLSRIDFISLMIALFCGTASLPHILIRYYTVKDAASARKSTVVGIAAIGFFYVLTLFLGLGAMTSGTLDLTDTNMSAPLLAKAFGELPFACISAIAFTTVLGTVSGLIMAAAGAIVHDLAVNVAGCKLDDERKVKWAKIAAIAVGALAMWLGILFAKINVTFLVGWAFNIAASANLPALIMLLFWKGTTKQGITWAITVGVLGSLAWVLGSTVAMQNVYGFSAEDAAKHAWVPFSQPAIVTVPLGFITLVVVSLFTRRKDLAQA
ncbi:MAG: cation acetate symporter [Planctomycetes bacterium]|nr:cation acetate symporter [Planctomycetota bacterium]